MEISMKGALALKQLRQQLQEDAGNGFPHAVLTELLILHDVCKSLDLSFFQAKDVLGESGWRGVVNYINGPACDGIDWERVNQVAQSL